MSRFPVRAQTVVAGLATTAALSPPAAIAAADLAGVGHRWFDLAAQFSAPAAVAALAVTLLLCLLRRRRSLIAGAVVTAACALAAAPQAFPPRTEPQAGAPTVRLYSANLWVGNDDVAAIRDSIAQAKPDVVILIETSDVPYGAIAELTPDLPHRVASPRIDWRGRGARTVVASRWPLTPLREEAGVHAQTTTVRSPLGPLRVTAVHLTRPWPYQIQWEQIRQIEALGEAVAAHPGAARVVAGDFNSVTDARIGRSFAARSGMAPAPAFPGTWPSTLPSWLGIGIDNVWLSPDVAVASRKVGAPNGSDHRPVITVLTRARR
ncbi:MAG TPA: endonuclease/exonuclease/phosphatase family protein [Brevundimonas sp.]|uniref:endonuclease/exonuclease/phosphatase family protein n=1 Tax=Brevundimonas sp. TaxID=1871086 RepID=UPI002DEFD624|nr:endonuclease/exonuclease/phosphatase family protein [Brevundimonas sp.]